jgi:23S rRNA (cytidine2498-2'-O)-methyltransferase
MESPGFIFVTCQVGAEPAVKAELARKWPAFRFAYSRPGFLTFKLPGGALADDFDLHSVFARAYGFSIGKVTGDTVDDCAAKFWELVAERPHDALHVWQRDLFEPGHRGYEPRLTELATEAEIAIRAKAESRRLKAEASKSQESPLHPLTPSPVHAASASPGQLVLDCIIVEPNEWWVGYHRAASIPSRWPGGMFNIEVPAEVVSRAYLKMEEALAWSRMPLKPGEHWVEIGSAPGGSSQALLGHGLQVMGIDPANMDPVVLGNPNFTHVKMRGADVRRREFRNVRYLTADINVAPQYTLDTVESIVTHPEVSIRGLILTLKLLEWKLADELPAYLDRIRSWGYGQVRARQLHHNRQEVCVAAVRKGRS